eukprot:212399_1
MISICCRALILLSWLTIGNSSDPPPHIIFVIADDLGWATVGWHDSEVQTPFVDSLRANESLSLLRHYVYKYCSPSRSSFLSGRLPLHVNEENRGISAPGGGVHLGMYLLPAILKRSTKGKYHTHQIGKWHAGMSNHQYLPVSRGFDSSFGYLGGAEDHYSHKSGGAIDFWDSTAPAKGYNGIYGDLIYNELVLNITKTHAEKYKDEQLFIYYALQVAHDPQQAPNQFIDLYPANMSKCYTSSCDRRTNDAMASVMDSAVKNLTQILKSTGLWDNTLLVFTADNGGPSGVDTKSGNNWPLRGGKHSDFEGGTRANAFVTGGFLPKERRGKSTDGYIHICDWYETFAHLVGVDTSKLPPLTTLPIPALDSLNIWGLIDGSNNTSPRTEIALSSVNGGGTGGGFISGNYKIVLGGQNNLGFFTGPQSPNQTKPYSDKGCPNICLFDIINDPTEHNDLSSQYPDIKQKLINRMHEISNTSFQTDCYGQSKDNASNKAKAAQIDGYWAPYGMCNCTKCSSPSY